MGLDPTARILTIRDWIAAEITAKVAPAGAADIVGASNDVNPIVITTLEPHGLFTSAIATITGVTGNTAANGTAEIIVINDTNFSITAVGNGAYTGGGEWTALRFTAIGSYRRYKVPELNIIRVDVQFDPHNKPEFVTEEESRGGTNASVWETYRLSIFVQRSMSLQGLAGTTGTTDMDTMVNLAVRIGKLYPPSRVITTTDGLETLIVSNVQTIFDDYQLYTGGVFTSTIQLELREMTDD